MSSVYSTVADYYGVDSANILCCSVSTLFELVAATSAVADASPPAYHAKPVLHARRITLDTDTLHFYSTARCISAHALTANTALSKTPNSSLSVTL